MKATAVSPSAIAFSQQEPEERIVARRLTLALTNGARDDRAEPSVHLTPRQLEVLALLCEGLPNKLICRRLDISAGTVKAHISSILRELGVASRLQAVVAARRRGLHSDRPEHSENVARVPTTAAASCYWTSPGA